MLDVHIIVLCRADALCSLDVLCRAQTLCIVTNVVVHDGQLSRSVAVIDVSTVDATSKVWTSSFPFAGGTVGRTRCL